MGEGKTEANGKDPRESTGSEQPEARPLPYRLLNKGQKRAFHEVAGHIESAVGRLKYLSGDKKPWAKKFAQRLDEHRSSQVIFVDGPRGGGKTSLQLSLIRAFGEESNDADFWGPSHKETNGQSSHASDPDEAELRKIREESSRLLSTIKNQVIWLHTLDMEPLPHPTNLLAAILTRIEAVVPTDGRCQCDEDSDLGDPLHPSRLGPLERLAKLKRDVSVAWEGNLAQRAPYLDSDAYAMEEIMTEEVRSRLNADLFDVLDEIARSTRWPDDIKNPLFLLPVDDFDLNPRRCLDLLHLVRMIHTPRLLLLIVGESELAEHMFRLKISAELSRVSQSHWASQIGDLMPKDDAARAQSIGAYALRKLIPPNQRVHLEPMTVDEAKEYNPQPQKADSLSLKDLFSRCKLVSSLSSDDSAQKIINLEKFLFVEGAEASRWKHVYSGAAFFFTAPRNIHDCWSRFSKFREIGDEKRFLELAIDTIAESYEEAVAEETGLTPTERRVFNDAVRKDFHGKWEFHTEGIETVAATAQGIRLSSLRGMENTNDMDRRRDIDYSILACHVKDFDFRPSGARKADPSHGEGLRHWRFLSDRTTAAIILLHDLLALFRPTGIVGDMLVPKPHQLVWAAGRWDYGRENHLIVPWPMPPWRSFWELCIFRSWWDAAVEKVRGMTGSVQFLRVEVLAYTWLYYGTAIARGNYPKDVNHIDNFINWAPKTREDAWKSVFREMKNVAVANTRIEANSSDSYGATREITARYWLGCVACTLLPESGLPNAIADYFMLDSESASALHAYWSQAHVAAHIRRWRAEQYARLWSYGFGELAEVLMRNAKKSLPYHSLNRLSEHPMCRDERFEHFKIRKEEIEHADRRAQVSKRLWASELGLMTDRMDIAKFFMSDEPIPTLEIPTVAPLGYDPKPISE